MAGGAVPHRSDQIPIFRLDQISDPADQEFDGLIPIPMNAAESLFGAEPDFFLRIEGADLTGEQIRSGDLVAVRKASDGSDGQLVVAAVGQGIVLGRLRTDDTGNLIEPTDAGANPIPVHEPGVRILGDVVGVLRDQSGLSVQRQP